jgi:predicted Zn-dependent protease
MRYTVMFALAIVALTAGALVAFAHLSTASLPSAPPVALVIAPDSSAVQSTEARVSVSDAVAPDAAAYAKVAAADSVWRTAHARRYTLAELRARGDGRRTARDSVEDRVFEYTKRGRRDLATRELERWVARHPSDRAMLLSLARLLNEQGRTDDAVARYRQLLGSGRNQHGGDDR